MTDTLQERDFSEYQGNDDVYTPEYTEPLISDRLPSHLISQAYAGADPAYVSKTNAIPHIYPTWRRVRGDGNCGFRCAAFGYCEALLKLRNVSTIEAECQRMRDLTSMVISQVGDLDYYFDDNIPPLFTDLAAWTQLEPAAANAKLAERFQDHDAVVWVIYYIRALAIGYMRTESAFYENFVDEGLGPYTDRMAKFDEEIDHVGFSALSAVFLQPAGIGLEINQLNRDPTTASLDREAFLPDDPIDIIRTLYRPGHYDMLYLPELSPASIAVHRTMLPDEWFQRSQNEDWSQPATHEFFQRYSPASDVASFAQPQTGQGSYDSISDAFDSDSNRSSTSLNENFNLVIDLDTTPVDTRTLPIRSAPRTKSSKSKALSRSKPPHTSRRKEPIPRGEYYHTHQNPMNIDHERFEPLHYTIEDMEYFRRHSPSKTIDVPATSPKLSDKLTPIHTRRQNGRVIRTYDAHKQSKLNARCDIEKVRDFST